MRFSLLAIGCLAFTSLYAEVDDEEEEIVCDIHYEAVYAKCDLRGKTQEIKISEKEAKFFALEPYKARGKINLDRKKRQLQLWIGRSF